MANTKLPLSRLDTTGIGSLKSRISTADIGSVTNLSKQHYLNTADLSQIE